jgi:peptide/nickel transport system substrate-binding protein
MEIIRKEQRDENEHPYIPEMKELYRQGRVTRREFLRNAALLGMSMAAMQTFLAGCAPEAPETAPPPTATDAPPTATNPPPTVAPTPTHIPTNTPAPVVKRGGTFKISGRIYGIDHPARFAWEDESEIVRHVNQYLTYTDANNVSHPYLLEKWDVSDDLETWTLHLREGVTWTTGEPFVADDVVFTMNEWLDPDVGSSILGLMSYLQPQNIEKVDDYTVKLYLDSPQVAVPEHLFHFPAHILDHRTFEGDWLENPVGTGPFTLEEWSVDERAVLKARRDGQYWEMGKDGDPLPYLDEIIHVDQGGEETARLSALKDGTIDAVYLWASGYQVVKDDPAIAINSITTTIAAVMRMRVDIEPWSDVRVRNALKYCQDREKILNLSYFGEGMVGIDAHVAPVHPAFCPMDPWPYDPEKAKALLAEAGYPDGIDVTWTVGSGWADQVSYAEIMKQDAAAGGFNITINAIPNDAYWDVWTEEPLASTGWGHRPLAIMTLPLAYICDASGEPVAWNETRWCDEEFSELLTQAMGTLDIEERREIMCQLQTIQQERGSIGIPYWKNRWVAYNPKFQDVIAHPSSSQDEWRKVWYDPDAG